VKSVENQARFFGSLDGLACIRRQWRQELESALRSESFSDRILYFFCHGLGGGTPDDPTLGDARIALTDGEPIRTVDVENWLDGRSLPSRPFVFINACQGGQPKTIFYETLALLLLKRKALGLIGAQIDLPVLFAEEYARRFFQAFLDPPDSGALPIGPLMRDLTRQFIDAHRNPLGLVYSLYHGLDCYVARSPDRRASHARDTAAVGGTV
jgi:hypothetical protein